MKLNYSEKIPYSTDLIGGTTSIERKEFQHDNFLQKMNELNLKYFCGNLFISNDVLE